MDSTYNKFIIEIEPAGENEPEPFVPFDSEERTLKVRLDKWLWAARFFKTRALARAAVEAGKVSYNGERVKPSREIELDAVLKIRMGKSERTVVIVGLSTRRHNTQKAEELYTETEESRALREQQAQEWQQHQLDAPRDSQANEFKPRRAVRFLRRAFTRGNESNVNQSSQPVFEFET